MFHRLWAAPSAALLLLVVPAVAAVPVAQAAAAGCPVSFSLDSVSPTMGQPGTKLWLDVTYGSACVSGGAWVDGSVASASVTFRGVPASVEGSAAPGVGWLYPEVPAGATTGPITLNITWSNGDVSAYTSPIPWVVPPPALVSVSQSGDTGEQCTVYAGGRPALLTGTNFGAVYDSDDAVLVDGHPDPEVTWLSSGNAAGIVSSLPASATEQITMTLPANIAPGRHTVAVRTATGTTVPLTIETGPATSTGCGTTPAPKSTSSDPSTSSSSGTVTSSSTTASSETQGTTPSTQSTPSTPSTPNTSASSTPLSIAGPSTLGVGGRGIYALRPTQTTHATWVSSDPTVATVTDAGLVTAHRAGSAVISAVSGGQAATKTVEVTQTPTVAKVTPSKPSSGSPSGPSGNGSRTPVKGHPAATTLAGLLVLLLVLLAALLFWLRRRPRRGQRPEPTSHD